MFCHIVKNRDLNDLNLLGDFVSTLQPWKGLSNSVEKLFLVCDVFHCVARLFVEAAAKSSSNTTSTTSDEFSTLRTELDPFMARIGLFRSSDNESGGSQFDSQGMDAFAPMADLGEWYSESQLITTLLGDNFAYFDPPNAAAIGNTDKLM